MAVKIVDVPEIGAVKLQKRKGARSIRLSIGANGEVRVSMPHWLPYQAGVKFALSKADWVQTQLEKQPVRLLAHGQPIGKSHHLYFAPDPHAIKISTRLRGSEIRITHPTNQRANDREVQAAAERAATRALRSQAEQLLPQRLRTLAENHDFSFKSVGVKRLSGRWGSCDNDQNVVLNLFLMQLPWHLIDYVLLHELTHTKAMNHGPDFWSEFEKHLPGAKKLRREIRQYQPAIGT